MSDIERDMCETNARCRRERTSGARRRELSTAMRVRCLVQHTKISQFRGH